MNCSRTSSPLALARLKSFGFLSYLCSCHAEVREQIDLDTIDLSNLNRQFLFQKQHVKRSKALVAQETAGKFNPLAKINAIHGNIKEPRFDVAYFKSFDIVLNALDNMGPSAGSLHFK